MTYKTNAAADTYLRHTSLHSSSSRAQRYKPRQTYQQTHTLTLTTQLQATTDLPANTHTHSHNWESTFHRPHAVLTAQSSASKQWHSWRPQTSQQSWKRCIPR